MKNSALKTSIPDNQWLFEHSICALPSRRSVETVSILKSRRIDLSGTNLNFTDSSSDLEASPSLAAADHNFVTNFLIDWLEKEIGFASLNGVRHRVVQGTDVCRISSRIVTSLVDAMRLWPGRWHSDRGDQTQSARGSLGGNPHSSALSDHCAQFTQRLDGTEGGRRFAGGRNISRASSAPF